ncbi:MAG: S41 family peptidase [Bacteroidota bacterium]
MKKVFWIIALSFLFSGVDAQESSCLQNLDFVIKHIEKNYPGFTDKITSKNQDIYHSFKRTLRSNVANTSSNDCAKILNEFLAYFKDGHLQLFDESGPVSNTFLYPNRNYPRDYPVHPTTYFEKLDDNTALIRMRSFYQREYPKVDSIIKAHKKTLSQVGQLIIDVRGNEGGATFTYSPILPYLGLDSIQHVGFDVLATEDNIEAYRELMESPYMPADQKPYLQRNIDVMKANPNQLVSLTEDYAEYVNQDERVHSIIILIDNTCGSTTEHFLFAAKQSPYVTLMGEHTIGMYDYGDMRRFDIPNSNWHVWTATNRSRRLNHGGGIDNVGIAPDIFLNHNRDWITEAVQYFETAKSKEPTK